MRVDALRETPEEKGRERRKKNPGRERKKEKDREERRRKRKKKREALQGHLEKGSIRPQKRLLESCVPLNRHVQNSTPYQTLLLSPLFRDPCSSSSQRN